MTVDLNSPEFQAAYGAFQQWYAEHSDDVNEELPVVLQAPLARAIGVFLGGRVPVAPLSDDDESLVRDVELRAANVVVDSSIEFLLEILRARFPKHAPKRLSIADLVDVVMSNCISVEQVAVDALEEIRRRAKESR